MAVAGFIAFGALILPYVVVPIRRSMGLPTYQWDADPKTHPVSIIVDLLIVCIRLQQRVSNTGTLEVNYAGTYFSAEACTILLKSSSHVSLLSFINLTFPFSTQCSSSELFPTFSPKTSISITLVKITRSITLKTRHCWQSGEI
jgi:hypothetical protein